MDAQTQQPPAHPASSAVALAGVGKRFNRHWALAHVDLELPTGASLLIAGANGSGKTTLLRLLCGLLRPSTGTIQIFGSSPATQPFEVRPRLSLVSHKTFLYDQLSAREHVDLWLSLIGRKDGSASTDWLDQVGLADRADDLVATFSAGMRKRLSLLRTRVERPDIVLLDEPFSALDPNGQVMIEGWLKELATQGKTLLVASHALERASVVCESAIVLERGQVVWRGPAKGLASGSLPTAKQPSRGSK